MAIEQAATLLEVVADQLQAHRLTAFWQTSHGIVELTVPGPRLLVGGQEVPWRQEAA